MHFMRPKRSISPGHDVGRPRVRRLRKAYRLLRDRAAHSGWALARQTYLKEESDKGRSGTEIMEDLDQIEAHIVAGVVYGAGPLMRHNASGARSRNAALFAVFIGLGVVACNAAAGVGAAQSIAVAVVGTFVTRELAGLLLKVRS
jgi:hypothetical protein